MSQETGEYLSLRRRLDARALLQVLNHQSRARPHVGELAVERGWLSWTQVLEVVQEGKSCDLRFGQLAVRRGWLRPAQVDELLAQQRRATPRLTEVARGLGLLDGGGRELAACGSGEEALVR